MEISSLGNAAPQQKYAPSETGDTEGNHSRSTTGPAESSATVSRESQSSQVPPPNPTSESGNEPQVIQTGENRTGGQINISI